MNKRHSAFTLVELLVVLAIIALLAAILFPAFKGAQESARQTNCSSNLQQIGFAVAQYRKDEGYYPDTLVDLLGEGTLVIDQDKKTPDNAPRANYYQLDAKATGYLKGGQDILTCPDDDTLALANGGRSSYGYLSKAPAIALPLSPNAAPVAAPANTDPSQYVWNYWGYRPDGFAYVSISDAAANNNVVCDMTANNPCANFYDPKLPYGQNNQIKNSMSNRFAAPTTIITHCAYHRLPTASNINAPGELYMVPADSANAKDIVLRVDGSVKAVDVSTWKKNAQGESTWQKQTS